MHINETTPTAQLVKLPSADTEEEPDLDNLFIWLAFSLHFFFVKGFILFGLKGLFAQIRWAREWYLGPIG
jgi:hypothetical protein